jgi:hypothetical protein
MRPRQIIFALVFYLIATFVFLHPLPIHLGDRIFENGDSYLHIWISSWEARALATPSAHLFDGNIFFPEANTLALSELVLPDQVIFAPVLALTHNPLIAYNCTLLLTFPLSAISMFALVSYLTRRYSAALIAGFIFGFTPIRLSHLHHVQLLSLMWLPLIFLFFDRWLQKKSWRDALLTAILFCAQYLTTVYIALYLVPVLLVYFFLHWSLSREKITAKFCLQFVAALMLVVVVLAPFLRHYRDLHQQWDLRPHESIKIFFSSDLWTSLLATFPSNVIYGKLFHSFSAPPFEQFFFTGFVPVLLALFAWRAWRERIVRIFFGLSVASYILALGPFLRISGHVTHIPLPYQWIFDPWPGLSMLRVPARAGLILLSTMTVLAAYGWIRMFEWMLSRWKTPSSFKVESGFCFVTLVLLGAEFLSVPIPLLPEVSGDHIPPVYHFLKNYPDPGGVLELPVVFKEFGTEPIVRDYTYFSAYHFKPIVIGYSGYFPPPFYELVAAARQLPGDGAMDTFEAIGVRTILLHTRAMTPQEVQAWQAPISSGARLAVIETFPDGDEVLALKPRLRISHDLNDANWTLAVESKSTEANQLRAVLESQGLRSSAFKYVAHPQLPQFPERPNARVNGSHVQVEWLDAQERVISSQRMTMRLPYVLNHASIPVRVDLPSRAGDYILRLRVLESPPLVVSTKVSIP